jgi:hypothetical protein
MQCNPATDFTRVPVGGSSPWLSATPPLTQVNLAIAGEGGPPSKRAKELLGVGHKYGDSAGSLQVLKIC